MNMITVKKGDQVKPITELAWKNLQEAGTTYGWERVIETPAELMGGTPAAPEPPAEQTTSITAEPPAVEATAESGQVAAPDVKAEEKPKATKPNAKAGK